MITAGFHVFWHTGRRVFIALFQKFQREHVCAFQGARAMWEQVIAPSDSSFQSSKVVYFNMETPLSSANVAELQERQVPLVSVGGFRHSPPLPPCPHGLTAPPEQEKIDPGCHDLPDHINEGIDGYVFSGDVTDLALQAQGFTELVVRPLTDFDFDVFWDIFLRMSADLSLPLPD